MEECSRFDQYWFSWVCAVEEVSGEFKELGSGQYQYQFRRLCFEKAQMVERNSSFPEGIRFQDCKVSLGISFGLSHELWVNHWMDSGELNIEWIQGNSAVMQKAFGISNEAHK